MRIVCDYFDDAARNAIGKLARGTDKTGDSLTITENHVLLDGRRQPS